MGNVMESKRYWETGGSMLCHEYLNDLPHGKWEGWFPDGVLWYRQFYTHGKLDGEASFWYNNGQRMYSHFYEKGKMCGRWIGYTENGEIAYDKSKVKADYGYCKLFPVRICPHEKGRVWYVTDDQNDKEDEVRCKFYHTTHQCEKNCGTYTCKRECDRCVYDKCMSMFTNFNWRQVYPKKEEKKEEIKTYYHL